MIQPKFDKYRKARTVQFLNDVLDILSAKDAKTLNLESKYNELKNKIDVLNSIWNLTKRSEITEKLRLLDNRRGSIYTGFKVTIETWSRNHYNDLKKEASKEIFTIVQKHHNNLRSLPYQEETAALRSLINDLKASHADKLATIQMKEWVNKIEEINNQFEKAYIERTQELSTRSYGEINDLKVETVAAYKSLITLFNARYTISEEEKLDNLGLFNKISTHLKQLIEQHNSAATRTREYNRDNIPADDSIDNEIIEDIEDNRPVTRELEDKTTEKP